MPNPFEHRKPNAEQVLRIERIRAAYLKCLDRVHFDCQASKYLGYAIKALEESCQWAVKSIAFEEKTE